MQCCTVPVMSGSGLLLKSARASSRQPGAIAITSYKRNFPLLIAGIQITSRWSA